MTNDRHLRIHANGTSESLEALQEIYGYLEAPTQLRRFCANRTDPSSHLSKLAELAVMYALYAD